MTPRRGPSMDDVIKDMMKLEVPPRAPLLLRWRQRGRSGTDLRNFTARDPAELLTNGFIAFRHLDPVSKCGPVVLQGMSMKHGSAVKSYPPWEDIEAVGSVDPARARQWLTENNNRLWKTAIDMLAG